MVARSSISKQVSEGSSNGKKANATSKASKQQGKALFKPSKTGKQEALISSSKKPLDQALAGKTFKKGGKAKA